MRLSESQVTEMAATMLTLDPHRLKGNPRGAVAQRGIWIAGALLVIGVASWRLRSFSSERGSAADGGLQRAAGARLLYSRGES